MFGYDELFSKQIRFRQFAANFIPRILAIVPTAMKLLRNFKQEIIIIYRKIFAAR